MKRPEEEQNFADGDGDAAAAEVREEDEEYESPWISCSTAWKCGPGEHRVKQYRV